VLPILSKISKISLGDLGLSGNPWFQPEQLEEFSKEMLRAYAYQQFPYRLRTLCIQHIENNPGLIQQANSLGILPLELNQEARQYLLRQDYEWQAGTNIIFFVNIQDIDPPLNDNYIPFYLDYQLANYGDIDHMLQVLGRRQLYQITDTDPKT